MVNCQLLVSGTRCLLVSLGCTSRIQLRHARRAGVGLGRLHFASACSCSGEHERGVHEEGRPPRRPASKRKTGPQGSHGSPRKRSRSSSHGLRNTVYLRSAHHILKFLSRCCAGSSISLSASGLSKSASRNRRTEPTALKRAGAAFVRASGVERTSRCTGIARSSEGRLHPFKIPHRQAAILCHRPRRHVPEPNQPIRSAPIRIYSPPD